MVLDNSTSSILSNNAGRSEANSGPFRIFIENLSSNDIESHCTKPGSKTRSYIKIDLFLRISSVKDSSKNADTEIGASTISMV
jgi:hypothetical protein